MRQGGIRPCLFSLASQYIHQQIHQQYTVLYRAPRIRPPLLLRGPGRLLQEVGRPAARAGWLGGALFVDAAAACVLLVVAANFLFLKY